MPRRVLFLSEVEQTRTIQAIMFQISKLFLTSTSCLCNKLIRSTNIDNMNSDIDALSL